MQADSFKQILKYLKLERQSLRSMLIFALVGNIMLLIIPFVIQQLVDQFSILVFQQATIFLILLALLALFGISIMRILQMHISERLQRRLFLKGVYSIKNKIVAQRKLKSNLGIDTINYVFESINLQKSLVPLIIDGLTLAIQSIIVFVLISFYHPLFFVYSALILLGLYFALIVLGRKTEALSLIESTKKYAVVNALQNMSLKNSDLEDKDLLSVENTLHDYFITRENRYQLYFRQSVTVLAIKIAASMMLLALGGFLVVKNQMSIGQLIASELIITNLLISLFKFTHLLDYWYDSHVGIHKLEKYFPDDGVTK